MTDENGTPVVLAVDDEDRVTDAYALWLSEYTVRTASDGDEALSKMDEDVDVVLLDREMPTVNGGEVLDRIREQGYDCRVAMVTGVEPDFDILDMGFDTYLTKPVTEDDLTETVEELRSRAEFDGRAQRFFSLVEKQSTLEAELSDRELETSDEYEGLTRAVDSLQHELDHTLTGFDEDVVKASYRDL